MVPRTQGVKVCRKHKGAVGSGHDPLWLKSEAPLCYLYQLTLCSWHTPEPFLQAQHRRATAVLAGTSAGA